MRSLSKIVKAHAVVLDKEKYKLSPLIINFPKKRVHSDEKDENPLLVSAEHIESIDHEGHDIETDLPQHEQFNLEEMLDDAKKQADELLVTAQEEYDRVVKDAYNNALEIMENAKNEGYSEGYKTGYDEGYKEGYGASEVLVDEANELKNAAIAHYEQIIHDSEGDIIQLILDISRKILLKELEEDDEIVFNLVKAGLARITQTEMLKIRVSESDYINLVSMKKRILPLLDKVEDIQIIQDDGMVKGDCLIETDSGNIDSGVGTQLDFIRTTFEELLKSE